MYNKKEREDYNNRRAYVCNMLGLTKNQYNSFRRIGNVLNKLYTDNCNGDFDNMEDAYLVAIGRQYEVADRKAKESGLHIYYQTDPRGATIYLDKKPIPENNYTTAYCIY